MSSYITSKQIMNFDQSLKNATFPFDKNRGACFVYQVHHLSSSNLLRQWASFKPLFFHQPTNGKRTSMGCEGWQNKFANHANLRDHACPCHDVTACLALWLLTCFFAAADFGTTTLLRGSSMCPGTTQMEHIWIVVWSSHHHLFNFFQPVPKLSFIMWGKPIMIHHPWLGMVNIP